jgi:hypothetical protein
VIEAVEQRVGYVVFRFLRLAKLPCLGAVPKDFDMPEAARDRILAWTDSFRSGLPAIALLVKGPAPLRNQVAGAIAFAAVVKGFTYFSGLLPSSVPIRSISAASYIDRVHGSFDDEQDDMDLVRSLRAGHHDRAGRTHNVRLAVLQDLGAESRTGQNRFAEQELQSLLRLRVEREVPTIVTTRYGSAWLKKTYDVNMLELIDQALTVVDLYGEGGGPVDDDEG